MDRIDVIVAINGEVKLEQHFEAASWELDAENIPYLNWVSEDTHGMRQIEVAPPDRILRLEARNARAVHPTADWASWEVFDRLFGRFPGQVAVLMGRWYPGKGWLTTRRGIVRHGQRMPPEEDVQHEVRSGLMAMKHRAKADGLEW